MHSARILRKILKAKNWDGISWRFLLHRGGIIIWMDHSDYRRTTRSWNYLDCPLVAKSGISSARIGTSEPVGIMKRCRTCAIVRHSRLFIELDSVLLASGPGKL